MSGLRRLAWFGGIGGATTLLYALLAWVMTVPLGWWPWLASALAYGICGIGGFLSHKRLTFRSNAPAAGEVRRFVATSVVGYGIATGLPWLLTQSLQYDARIAIIAVCIVCPLVNYVLLNSFVFAKPAGPRQAKPAGPQQAN